MATRSLALAILLTATFFQSAAAVHRQEELSPLASIIEATDPASGLFGSSSAEQPGYEEAVIVVERELLGPFSATSLRLAEGPELILIEEGTLTIVDDTKGEEIVKAGSWYGVAPNASVGVRNDDLTDARMLRLMVIREPTTAKRPIVRNFARQEATSHGNTGGRPNVAIAPQSPTLIDFRTVTEIGELPAGELTVFLAKWTLEPGDPFAEPNAAAYLSVGGPVSVYARTGVVRLYVNGPEDEPMIAELRAGVCQLIPAGVPFFPQGIGEEPAELIVAGVIAPSGGDTQRLETASSPETMDSPACSASTA